MARIIGALHSLCLTARDFVIPPEVDLTPPEPEPDVWQDTARPDDSASAEAVRSWLDAAVPPVPEDGCWHCDRTPAQHGLLPMESGLQYAALTGEHRWVPPNQMQITGRRKARDRAQEVAS